MYTKGVNNMGMPNTAMEDYAAEVRNEEAVEESKEETKEDK